MARCPDRVNWWLGVACALSLLGAGPAEAAFVPAPGSPYTVGNEPYSVTPGDFTSDALSDLAVVNGTSSTVHVFNQQAGNGGFALAAGSPFSVGSGPDFAAAADFNADGREDLAVANYVDGTISVLLRQANDQFASEGAPIAVGGSPGGVATGDFNGDGRADLVVVGFNVGAVRLLLRKGDNTGFTAGAPVATGGTNGRYVAVGDLDGTGPPDVALTNAGSANVSVMLGQPGGTLAAASGSPFAVGTTPQFVAIAKLDDDARPDLAVANYADDTVTVLKRTDTGFAPLTGSPYPVGDAPVGVAAADFRESGHNDLVVANSGSTSFSLLEGDGTTFTRRPDRAVSIAGTSPYGITTGRFNDGDPFPDVAVTSIRATPAGDNYLDVFFNRPPPRAGTADATAVTPTGATLNASVNPRGTDTSAFFEYGPTAAYGSRAPAGGDLNAGNDLADHVVSRAVTGLTPNTTYHFRVVTANAGGETRGEDRTFATAPLPAEPPPPSTTVDGPPQAFLSAPATVSVGTATTLSAEGSTPASGLTFTWDLDGDGTYETDTKQARSLPTTFTVPGDVKVALRATDAAGRSDEVRRTVRVTAPPVYTLDIAPTNPKAGDTVRFTVREVVGTRRQGLATGSLALLTYGDGKPVSGRVGGILYTDRDPSPTGDLSHVFARSGTYKIHAAIDDGKGYRQSVDVSLRVGSRNTYTPAITTTSTTVDQGSCVFFANGSASALPVVHTGPEVTENINPVNQIPIVKPPSTITIGGGINFDRTLVSPSLLTRNQVIAGSPAAHLQFTNVASLGVNFNVAGGRRAKLRQAEPTVTTNGDKACQVQRDFETALANASRLAKPYPPGADKGLPVIPSCPGGQVATTFATIPTSVTPVERKSRTSRYTWFSINRWDFGDGTRSGPEAYLPSYKVFHPYDKGGDYTVRLTTTTPADLDTQLADWTKACASNPLNATKDDDRFETQSTTVKIHVRQKFDRIKSRGLWLTSSDTFTETDLPNVYESSGSIFINTRRIGHTYDINTGTYDASRGVEGVAGVLIVTPTDRPLRLNADNGEITGAANLRFAAGNLQEVGLGPMPLNIRGTPGLVIPTAGAGGTHDFGNFADPPAVLGSGTKVPPKGAAFHVNNAHVVLKEGGGGTIDFNVHLPEPLGPNGQSADITVTRDVRGNGRAVSSGKFRGILDNVDVTLPAIDLAPGFLTFNGGRLIHKQRETPPWQATGSLTVLGKNVSMDKNTRTPGCPVEGGLGFYEDGGLYNAGAVLAGLKIPIPNPPAPPVSALTDPALQVFPGSSSRPLNLNGCLTIADYPSDNVFRVTGCVGFLLAGDGVDVPNNQVIRFCPDAKGNQNYPRTIYNSYASPRGPGFRRMKGFVIRVSGTVGLGPTHFQVAQAYIEYVNDPLQVMAAGHVGISLLGGNITVGGDVFGFFRSPSDWAFGGQGGVTQKLLCVPNPFGSPLCPSASVAVLLGAKGFGACVTIFGVGIGGDIRFADRSLTPHFPGCDADLLKTDLGVQGIRALPRYGDLRQAPPVLPPAPVTSASVTLPGGRPSATIIVNGAGRSPVVQVRDPKGRLVLDDTGAARQGLKQEFKAPPAAVDVQGGEAVPAPQTPKLAAQQGILHNDDGALTDQGLDLRNSTILLLRDPVAGRYTITTKAGSAPITAVSHAAARPDPVVTGGVVSGKGGQKLLTVASKLPVGTTLSLSEEAAHVSRSIGATASARAFAASPTARIARVNQQIRFTPAPGPGGTRRIVAIVSRDGIPKRRIVLGSYRAPAPAKAGRVGRLRGTVTGSRLKLSWTPARNARRYVVVVKLKRGLPLTLSAGPKARGIVVTEALARLGATVQVRAIGPLSTAGPTATTKVAPVKAKRLRTFSL